MSDPTKTAADFKPDDVAPAPSVLDDQVDNKSIKYDSVFGELSEDGPNFRGVGWMGTSVLMMKPQFGLGVLSIPFVLQVLGLVPGVLAIVGIGIISLWSSYIVGEFKLRHRHVYGIDDAADMMFGKWGREVFGVVFCLFFIFCAAAAMITVSVAFNAVSTHGARTAIFIAVAGIVGFVFGSIRTLSRIKRVEKSELFLGGLNLGREFRSNIWLS
ncbi:hypothetical protein NUW58_g72 [Xylaria curta]|uniref:Uncharacterized protein n=2 Tax=Xylaria curta TaxID=42375 RepID=A0ACC1PTJ2_9PEZI|nr:hypothetical protein NUW58_g1759 [Xylaria curta]KAJ2999202.1 hypothetical protein NUW58_g72 [Xylaria curta]